MPTAKHSDFRSSGTRLGRTRRDQILRQATELFQRRGYSNTSLDDIASAVGIRREGIYYYFDNRAQILLNIVKPISLELLERMREVAASNMTPVQKLATAVERHLMHFEKRFGETKIALRDDYAAERDAVAAELGPIWQEYEELWISVIRDGQIRSLFNPDLDPKIAYYGIIGMCNSVARWYEPKAMLPVPRLVEVYVRMCLACLRRSDGEGLDVLASPVPRAS